MTTLPIKPEQGQTPRTAQWSSLQQMAIRYKGLPKDSVERAELREQMARHLAGVFVQCIVEDEPTETDHVKGQPNAGQATESAQASSESGARFKRRDSLLVSMFREALFKHAKKSDAGFVLPDAHGGVSNFAPQAAQAFLLERQHRARDATMIEALVRDWDGTGSLQGFMRRCVSGFLADMANARKPGKRQTGARRVKDGDEAAQALAQQRYEERQQLLRGDGAPLEEQNPLPRALAFEAEGGYEEGDEDEVDASNEAALRVRQWVGSHLHQQTPLDQALIQQWMGLEEPVTGKELAARFGLSEARVSQRKNEVIERLRGVLGD